MQGVSRWTVLELGKNREKGEWEEYTQSVDGGRDRRRTSREGDGGSSVGDGDVNHRRAAWDAGKQGIKEETTGRGIKSGGCA